MNSQEDPLGETSGFTEFSQPRQVINAFQTVVADVESFLSEWTVKVQRELASLDLTDGDQALRQRRQALQEERKRWEAKRQRELDEIEHKANQLTEAWLRLEDEQRRLLQTQDKQRAARRDAPPALLSPAPLSPAPLSPAPLPPATLPPAPLAHISRSASAQVNPDEIRSGSRERPTSAIGTGRRCPGGAVRSISDAVRQFEQLRREIEFTRAST
jgi:hypothetical protein